MKFLSTKLVLLLALFVEFAASKNRRAHHGTVGGGVEDVAKVAKKMDQRVLDDVSDDDEADDLGDATEETESSVLDHKEPNDDQNDQPGQDDVETEAGEAESGMLEHGESNDDQDDLDDNQQGQVNVEAELESEETDVQSENVKNEKPRSKKSRTGSVKQDNHTKSKKGTKNKSHGGNDGSKNGTRRNGSHRQGRSNAARNGDNDAGNEDVDSNTMSTALKSISCPTDQFIPNGLSKGKISGCERTANNVTIGKWRRKRNESKTEVVICNARKVKFGSSEAFLYHKKGQYHHLTDAAKLIVNHDQIKGVECPKDDSLVSMDLASVVWTQQEMEETFGSPDKIKSQNMNNKLAKIVEPAIIGTLFLICAVLGVFIARKDSKGPQGANEGIQQQVQNATEPTTRKQADKFTL